MAKKTKRHCSEPPRLAKLTPEQVDTYIEKLASKVTDDAELVEFFSLALRGSLWFAQQLELGMLTIAKLRKLFEIQGSELARNRNPVHVKVVEADNSTKIQAKGHGRNSADAYLGATVVEVDHPDLSPGDTCPAAGCEGRLYEMSDPGVVIRITGAPLAQATRYNQQKLRCAVCEVVYTAPLPVAVGHQKYDESFAAMLMINKYFMSMPLYRQDRLQNYLGVPLPSSTQWDIMYQYKPVVKAVYGALWVNAANGDGIGFDDTALKILTAIKAKKAALPGEKKNHHCFTTGIVSIYEDHRVYVYAHDHKTAGQTIAHLLSHRELGTGQPLLMCDALSANIPAGISEDLYTLCYCLVHARRQFYELPDGYDDLADRVIDLIAKIYDHESQAKAMDANARLLHHQKHSEPVMMELKQYLETQREQFEPNSVAGRAIEYLLKRFTGLTQFLRHAKAPIDNNLVEQALKLVIQTRKSSMFYKSLSSAEFASHVQSMLYSAARNGVNPCEYMTAVLQHSDDAIEHPEQWLPWCYQDRLRQMKGACAKTSSSSLASPG